MALKWSSEFILEGSLRADESPRAHLPLKLLKLPKVPILPCSRKSFPQLPPLVLCAGGGEPFSSTRAHGGGGRSSFMVPGKFVSKTYLGPIFRDSDSGRGRVPP